MSANLVVDLGNTTIRRASVSPAVGVGNTPASGTLVGEIIDMLHANTLTNLYVGGGPSSGRLSVQVQTSDDPTLSGSFTDPTSGLDTLPTAFLSGGVFLVNSGIPGSGNQIDQSPVSGATVFCSGGMTFAGFQRPHRYVRALAMSGTFTAPVNIGFIGQAKTTGSGGGFTLLPGSGAVQV